LLLEKISKDLPAYARARATNKQPILKLKRPPSNAQNLHSTWDGRSAGALELLAFKSSRALGQAHWLAELIPQSTGSGFSQP